MYVQLFKKLLNNFRRSCLRQGRDEEGTESPWVEPCGTGVCALCLFILLCVRLLSVSLFLSFSQSIVISQQIQFIQNEIVSCSSGFGVFSLFPQQAIGLLSDDTHRK